MAALSSDHRLWVPMQIQSLVFGKPGTAAFLDLTPRYEELGDRAEAPLGRRLRPNLDRTTQRPPFLRRGIHLHWMLPAAFTHLRPADGAGPSRVPNRWLVTRLWLDAGRLRLRCWVVESDTVSDEGAVPWLDARLDPTLLLGLTRDLGDWAEPGTADPAFSAFAPGNLGFAAFYPSCRGVFGFHDECEDLPADCVCSYLVTGWFSDPAADPLYMDDPRPGEAEAPQARWLQRMEDLRWAVAGDAACQPTAVTCYAMAPGIRWTPDAVCTAAARPDLSVAVGGSFVEALGALARRNGTVAERDDFVSLQQLAALDERHPTEADLTPGFFRELGCMLGAQARLHERSFSGRDGGSFWEIIPSERVPNGKEAEASSSPVLPPDLAASLAEINRLQAVRDAADRALADARDRLFLAWSQQQHWTIRADDRATPAQARALAAEVAARVAEVSDAAARCAALQAQRDGRREDILARLRAADARDLALVPRAMPRFWRPSDPFFLMAGLPVPALQGGASPLLCRVSDQTVPGLDGGASVARSTLRAYLDDHLRPMPDLPPGRTGIPPDWFDLLLDTIFVDSGMARILAVAVLKERITDPREEQIAKLRDTIAKVQAPVWTAADRLNRGLSEETAELPLGLDTAAQRSLLSAIWLPEAPPRPAFMVWTADWLCHGTGEGALPAGWALARDGIDYRWQGPLPEGETHALDGFVPLATGLERGLAATREQFPDLGFIFQGLDRLAGQSLSGLTEALATRDAGAQLQPLRRGPSGLAVDPVDAPIAGRHLAGPLTGDDAASPFAPVRGGRLTITRLWIVDSFGRVQRLIDGEDGGAREAPAIARSLRIAGGDAMLLPPRLVQPARLRLCWRSARHGDADSRGDLETSPVCGFVLHNRLDRSLLIYGARDAAQRMPDSFLGALQPVRRDHGQEVARWCAMPARPFKPRPGADPTEPARPSPADIPDRQLRSFVNGLLDRFGGAAGRGFQDFRALLADHEDGAGLSSDQGLQAMLVGRPLALVRASLRLELDARPVADQNWRAILGAKPPAPPWVRDIAFPARIGDRNLGPEGLVGLFVDDGSEAAFRTLRLRTDRAYPAGITDHPYYSRAPLAVPADPDAAPLSLTLLLDPRRPVHLVPGILPASTVSVPEGSVTAAMAGLEIPFLVAPVLGELAPSTGRSMPLPTNSHDEWRWVAFPDPTSPAVEMPVSGDTAAAGALQATKALHEGWLRYCPPKRGRP